MVMKFRSVRGLPEQYLRGCVLERISGLRPSYGIPIIDMNMWKWLARSL
jgi:hypothetical protein